MHLGHERLRFFSVSQITTWQRARSIRTRASRAVCAALRKKSRALAITICPKIPRNLNAAFNHRAHDALSSPRRNAQRSQRAARNLHNTNHRAQTERPHDQRGDGARRWLGSRAFYRTFADREEPPLRSQARSAAQRHETAKRAAKRSGAERHETAEHTLLPNSRARARDRDSVIAN